MGALLFPGQGSQIVGMGYEFFNNFKTVKNIFERADTKLGYSISKLILNGPEENLQLTENTQPAILIVSYSIFKILKEEFGFNLNKIKFFAGHSLGEYSALVCSGGISFEDALFLLHERGKAMQNSVPVGSGSMIAVLGLKIDEVKILLESEKEKEGVCEIANDNAEGQVILSGEKNAVDIFKKKLKEKKIKTIPLKVSAPFHCSLMKPAANIMKDNINRTKFEKIKFKIVSNVNAKAISEPEEIKKLLIEQIYSTVRWRESVINMSNSGVTNFLEIGPGKVLTGMVKRTIKNSKTFSINSIADIKSLSNEF